MPESNAPPARPLRLNYATLHGPFDGVYADSDPDPPPDLGGVSEF